MSQAKRAYAEGRLKRNSTFLQDVSSGTSIYSRISHAKGEISRGSFKRHERFVRGCLKRKKQLLEDVSSGMTDLTRMSQARREICSR
eukprot:6754204-Pyramimonas_sp.AAC.1